MRSFSSLQMVRLALVLGLGRSEGAGVVDQAHGEGAKVSKDTAPGDVAEFWDRFLGGLVAPAHSTSMSMTPSPTPATPVPTPATPVPTPATPVPTPATPAPTPATPVPTPATPVPTPATPVPTPATPVPTPATPVPTPATPVPTPATPVPTPATPVPTPATPVPTPATPVPTPATPVPTPATPVPTPATPVPTPATPVPTPATPVPTPATPVPTPATPVPTPATPVPTPATPVPTPATPVPTPATPVPTPATPVPTPATPVPTPATPVPTPATPVPTPATPVPTPATPVPTPATPVPTPATPVPTPATPVPTPATPVPTPATPVPTPATPVPTPATPPPTLASSPPTVMMPCELNITLDCPGCEVDLNQTSCLERPFMMGFFLRGGNCSENNFSQPLEQVTCVDYPQNGDVPKQGSGETVYIRFNRDPGDKGDGDDFPSLFDDFVAVGENYYVYTGNSSLPLPPDTQIRIYKNENRTDANILQDVRFHASCSSPLLLDNIFGASQLIQFENNLQGNVSTTASVLTNFNITIPLNNPVGDEILNVTFATIRTNYTEPPLTNLDGLIGQLICSEAVANDPTSGCNQTEIEVEFETTLNLAVSSGYFQQVIVGAQSIESDTRCIGNATNEFFVQGINDNND